MPLALLLDEHLPTALASSLRTSGLDAIHVVEAAWRGLDDEALLATATAHERVLVTADVRHFPNIARKWAEEDRPHAGIMLVPRSGLPVGELLRRLVAQCRNWDTSRQSQVVFLASRRPPLRS